MNILLVNQFSSTKFVSDYFKSKNINTIGLYTKKLDQFTEYARPNPDFFDKQIFIDLNDVANIESILKPYTIDFVINGTENYTDITDIIASKITPNYANDPNTSILRMDKFHMHKHLEKCNINYIQQSIFNYKNDDLQNFVLNHKIKYPCFVKPLHGLGSYCVSKIDSYDNLKQTLDLFNNIDEIKLNINSESPKIENLDFLICDYIDGEEYFIDSFSYKGKHYISSIHKYIKTIINNIPVYRYGEIVKDRSIIEKLIDYTKDVLSALGNNFGFAHTEVKIDSSNNPVLIELNPRISGGHGFPNIICQYANLYSQPELLEIVLSNSSEISKLNTPINPTGHNIWLPIFNWSGKHVPEISEKLKDFKTLAYYKQFKSGNLPAPNINTHLLSTIGFLILSSNDINLINQELNLILDYDKNGWV